MHLLPYKPTISLIFPFYENIVLNNQVLLINLYCHQTKREGKYSQVPHLTKDTTWASNKNKRNLTYTRAKRSQ